MRIPRVASRYAKSLVSLAQERNELDAIKNDVDFILSALKEHRELRAVIASPVIKPKKKKTILSEVFASSVSGLTITFLHLLVDHRREQNAQEVLESFKTQYLVAKNIVKAIITTPIELDDELRAQFMAMVKEQTKHEVLIEEKINPELIGGYVVRVGDMEYDASISGKLKKLKREFEENPYASAL